MLMIILSILNLAMLFCPSNYKIWLREPPSRLILEKSILCGRHFLYPQEHNVVLNLMFIWMVCSFIALYVLLTFLKLVTLYRTHLSLLGNAGKNLLVFRGRLVA